MTIKYSIWTNPCEAETKMDSTQSNSLLMHRRTNARTHIKLIKIAQRDLFLSEFFFSP